MSSTSENLNVKTLKQIETESTRMLFVVLIVGIIGNSISFQIFREKKFRSNPIAILFSASSLFNIFVLIYGIGTSLYIVDHLNPENYSILFCKIRFYLRHILLMIVRTYISLSCFSCYLLTSSRPSIRSYSQPKHIKRMIIIVPFLWPIIAFHMPIWNNIIHNRCLNLSNYVLPFGIYFFLVGGILPILSMILFIGLTIRNLRYLHHRIQSSLTYSQRFQKRDRQFIRMLISIVLMYIITNIFFPTNQLYLSITYWSSKTSQRLAIESLVFSFTSNYILYINNVSPFFLFFLSSNHFRQSVFRWFKRWKHRIVHRGERIQPFSLVLSRRLTSNKRI